MNADDLRRAERLCYSVNLAGGMILLEAGQLRVIQPRGGLPSPVQTAIVEAKLALLHYLRHGRYLSEEEMAERRQRAKVPVNG